MALGFSFLRRLRRSAPVLLLLAAACVPGLAPKPTVTPDPRLPKPLEFSGVGDASLALGPWSGPAVLHLTAGGAGTFQASLSRGLDYHAIVQTTEAVDEYRTVSFDSSEPVLLKLQGKRSWKAALFPAAPGYFPVLQVPGVYSGSGSAVVLLEGPYSIAIFKAADLQKITAWAGGPGGVNEQLSFKLEGDYQGRAVLPKDAGWIIVSGPRSWSMEVQAPCCIAPPGYENTPVP